MTYLINLCFTTGKFPEILKEAAVVPIHKTGDKSQMINYRPIALISNIAKIFEMCLKDRIMSFVNENKLLNDNQFGFRENKSTTDALAYFVDEIHSTDQRTNYGRL